MRFNLHHTNSWVTSTQRSSCPPAKVFNSENMKKPTCIQGLWWNLLSQQTFHPEGEKNSDNFFDRSHLWVRLHTWRNQDCQEVFLKIDFLNAWTTHINTSIQAIHIRMRFCNIIVKIHKLRKYTNTQITQIHKPDGLALSMSPPHTHSHPHPSPGNN